MELDYTQLICRCVMTYAVHMDIITPPTQNMVLMKMLTFRFIVELGQKPILVRSIYGMME